MRPIDADALKYFISRQLAMTASTAVVMNAKDFFENIVDNAPTIDAVPVVRCNECKYWQQVTPNSGNCAMGFAPTAYADDFCSFGERSEE